MSVYGEEDKKAGFMKGKGIETILKGRSHCILSCYEHQQNYR